MHAEDGFKKTNKKLMGVIVQPEVIPSLDGHLTLQDVLAALVVLSSRF